MKNLVFYITLFSWKTLKDFASTKNLLIQKHCFYENFFFENFVSMKIFVFRILFYENFVFLKTFVFLNKPVFMNTLVVFFEKFV